MSVRGCAESLDCHGRIFDPTYRERGSCLPRCDLLLTDNGSLNYLVGFALPLYTIGKRALTKQRGPRE